MERTKPKPQVYELETVEGKLKELGLDDWYLEDGWIRRKYNTDGWPTTLMLVNTIGYLCEAAWHHADLAVTWGKVWVKLTTHSSGGLPKTTSPPGARTRTRGCGGPAPATPPKGPPTRSGPR